MVDGHVGGGGAWVILQFLAIPQGFSSRCLGTSHQLSQGRPRVMHGGSRAFSRMLGCCCRERPVLPRRLLDCLKVVANPTDALQLAKLWAQRNRAVCQAFREIVGVAEVAK